MEELETTLLLLRKDEQILLAMKKRGFGEGKYNGVGGKIKEGETPEQAMIRETMEEISVVPVEYEKVGVIKFLEYYKGKKEKVSFHLYTASKWEGDIKESEEMKPEWFNVNEIPYDKMLPDDKFWMPYVLDNKKIDAYFEFDEDWNMLKKEINEK